MSKPLTNSELYQLDCRRQRDAKSRYINEMKTRKQELSKSDIKRSISFLKGFGIKVKDKDIPCFKNICELTRWQRGLVKECLSEC